LNCREVTLQQAGFSRRALDRAAATARAAQRHEINDFTVRKICRDLEIAASEGQPAARNC
jgi:hypothetical protein